MTGAARLMAIGRLPGRRRARHRGASRPGSSPWSRPGSPRRHSSPCPRRPVAPSRERGDRRSPNDSRRCDALAIGPGLAPRRGDRGVRARPRAALSRPDGARRRCAQRVRGPRERIWPTGKSEAMLTPHVGEFARLCRASAARSGGRPLRARARARAAGPSAVVAAQGKPDRDRGAGRHGVPRQPDRAPGARDGRVRATSSPARSAGCSRGDWTPARRGIGRGVPPRAGRHPRRPGRAARATVRDVRIVLAASRGRRSQRRGGGVSADGFRPTVASRSTSTRSATTSGVLTARRRRAHGRREGERVRPRRRRGGARRLGGRRHVARRGARRGGPRAARRRDRGADPGAVRVPARRRGGRARHDSRRTVFTPRRLARVIAAAAAAAARRRST